jgi:cell wall-associated NlpC family hydrolase
MKYQVIFCILLILISSVDVASAKRKKKKTRKVARTEQVEEIENFDFLYADQYDTDVNFANIGDILQQATSKIGARYRSGSKGPNAFDCSGFTSYIYGLNNISIGASSRDQYARNIPISREEMQPGDLVFFTSPGSGRNVGHVGIVMDVDPINDTFTFIHASSKEGVKISQSTDGYYEKRYVGVRRVAK